VQVGAEEEDALIGEEVVVVLPAELLSDQPAALHALHQIHNLQVGDGDLSVLGLADVLLHDDDTLYTKFRRLVMRFLGRRYGCTVDEVLVDGLNVFLGNEHLHTEGKIIMSSYKAASSTIFRMDYLGMVALEGESTRKIFRMGPWSPWST